MRFVSLLAVATATVIALPASAATYVTPTSTFTGLGDTIGSPFDQVTLNGITGTINSPGTYLLHTVDFTVGVNSVNGGIYTGSFADSILIGSANYTFSLPYTLTISSADTIVFESTVFRRDGLRFEINPLTLNSGVGTAVGDLTVTVNVPEPATWGLMIVGFGAVGGAMRRRAVVRRSVAFA